MKNFTNSFLRSPNSDKNNNMVPTGVSAKSSSSVSKIDVHMPLKKVGESNDTTIADFDQFDYMESEKYKKRAQIIANTPLIEDERNIEKERAACMELIEE